MKFSSYMTIVTYFMALLGLYSVTLVESVSPGFMALIIGAVFISLVLNVKKKRVLPSRIWNFLALVIFIIFVADYLLTAKDLWDIITIATRFLIILLAVKLFDLNANRDYVIVYGAVFFLILAAAATTMSLVFLPLLVVFIISAIFAMIVINIKKEFDLRGLAGTEPPPGLFDAPFFISLVTVTTVSVGVTFILFFIIPRMETGFFQRKTLNAIKVTGFSDTVEFGAIGTVKKDHTVVMRVEFPGAKRPAGPIYFRGAVLEEYDGTAWKRRTGPNSLVRNKGGLFTFQKPGRRLVEQKILLEPLSTEVLFAEPYAVRLSAPFPNIWRDAAGAIYLPSPPYSRIRYTVWSSPGASPTGPESGNDMRRLLDLTGAAGGDAGGRLKDLAARLTAGKKTAAQKAAAVKAYLSENYRYTLDVGKGGGTNPIDDFLFFTKEGYCEHFATAFAMLLRAANVPTRLVTGFLQGEWNDMGGYFIVRQSDAHSWTEVYLDGTGWTRFDPTPSAGLKPFSPTSRLSLYLDYMRLKWNRYIISYTSVDQKRFAGNLSARSSSLIAGLKRAMKTGAIRGFLLPLAAGFILVAAAFIIIVRKKGALLTRPAKTPPFYLEMLKILSKKGFCRLSSETPVEFSLRIGDAGVKLITELYMEERYGGRSAGSGDMERVRGIILGLKKLQVKTKKYEPA
ncbi:MAG: DUF3488 and transglutaminase-like domain-containing protein [Thermodesulfobacteriota bacterium]|nr:MAG: DUF3488 and transglutaminase-like domain-containing protein [Thermodesulfobacteriota bacterium]